MNNKKLLFIIGTRPELIKCAPVVYALRNAGYTVKICFTGQHKQMLDQAAKQFKLVGNYNLRIMRKNQSLADVTSKTLKGLKPILEKEKPRLIIVQGDTTTAFAGALEAFYNKIPVAHIEAGLRTDQIYSPFPEEINRRLISQLALIHFAPTAQAAKNLEKSGISKNNIHITGNTVIDALFWTAAQELEPEDKKLKSIDTTNKKIILITTHRRENTGTKMNEIFKAVIKIKRNEPDALFIFPVHLNPKIQKLAHRFLENIEDVILLNPLNYGDLVYLLKKSYVVLTDSGGIQEEAPSFGKPVLVMRDTTERLEGIDAGTAKLVGTNQKTIYDNTIKLLRDSKYYGKMSQATNPYGDGTASAKIVNIINSYVKKS